MLTFVWPFTTFETRSSSNCLVKMITASENACLALQLYRDVPHIRIADAGGPKSQFILSCRFIDDSCVHIDSVSVYWENCQPFRSVRLSCVVKWAKISSLAWRCYFDPCKGIPTVSPYHNASWLVLTESQPMLRSFWSMCNCPVCQVW